MCDLSSVISCDLSFVITCDMQEIVSFCHSQGVIVLVDGAHALGSMQLDLRWVVCVCACVDRRGDGRGVEGREGEWRGAEGKGGERRGGEGSGGEGRGAEGRGGE